MGLYEDQQRKNKAQRNARRARKNTAALVPKAAMATLKPQGNISAADQKRFDQSASANKKLIGGVSSALGNAQTALANTSQVNQGYRDFQAKGPHRSSTPMVTQGPGQALGPEEPRKPFNMVNPLQTGKNPRGLTPSLNQSRTGIGQSNSREPGRVDVGLASNRESDELLNSPVFSSDKKKQKHQLTRNQMLSGDHTLRIGNYTNVKFDKDVPLANRQAFARQPSNGATRRVSGALRQRLTGNSGSGMPTRSGSLHMQQAMRPQQEPRQELIGKDSGMGWKSRLALNKQILANRQSGANNLNTNATVGRGQDRRFQLGQMQNSTTQRGQTQDFALGLQRDATTSRGQDQTYGVGKDRNAAIREGDTQEFQLGTDRNQMLRDDVDSKVRASDQAFTQQQNIEGAQDNLRSAIASRNPDKIAQAKANLGAFSYSAPQSAKLSTPEALAKLEQMGISNYNDWASRFQPGDPKASVESYQAFLRKLNSDPNDSVGQYL